MQVVKSVPLTQKSLRWTPAFCGRFDDGTTITLVYDRRFYGGLTQSVRYESHIWYREQREAWSVTVHRLKVCATYEVTSGNGCLLAGPRIAAALNVPPG